MLNILIVGRDEKMGPVNVQSCGLMLNRLRRLRLRLLLQEVFKVHWDMFYEQEKRRHKVKKWRKKKEILCLDKRACPPLSPLPRLPFFSFLLFKMKWNVSCVYFIEVCVCRVSAAVCEQRQLVSRQQQQQQQLSWVELKVIGSIPTSSWLHSGVLLVAHFETKLLFFFFKFIHSSSVRIRFSPSSRHWCNRANSELNRSFQPLAGAQCELLLLNLVSVCLLFLSCTVTVLQ